MTTSLNTVPLGYWELFDPDTAAPALHPLLAERRSWRRFDPGRTVRDDQVHALLEAARWAPSSRNSQPWRFLVGRRGDDVFDRLLAVLSPGNRRWAQDAGALVLVATRFADDDGRPLRFAAYDVGGAVAHLGVQAQAEGLAVCQMGGFDATAAVSGFGLDPDLRPVVVLAVGAAQPSTASDPAEGQRARKPLAELILPVRPADGAAAA